jgi:hypothetical protein
MRGFLDGSVLMFEIERARLKRVFSASKESLAAAI